MKMTETGVVSMHDRTLGAVEAWALAKFLADHGVDTGRILGEVRLDAGTLHDHRTRISLAQQLHLQAHARRHARMVAPPLLIGRSLHLTAFGTVGFTMLSSATVEQALAVATRYARLLTMKFDLEVRIEPGHAVIQFHDRYMLDGEAREECLLLDMAKTVTLLRDLVGPEFELAELRLNAAPADLQPWQHRHFGCPVSQCEGNELRFAAHLLSFPLPQAHAPTCQGSLQICDRLVELDLNQQGLPYQVRKLLLDSSGVIASLADVADRMCMSPRTLRRRLEAFNTSYVRIVEDVRKTLAMRILASSAMKTEAIAERLGYSDAANFRHAFKRWTGCSPREYRQQATLAAQGSRRPAMTDTSHAPCLTAHSAEIAMETVAEYA